MTDAELYDGGEDWDEYLFPLSFQQTRLWFLEQLDPGNAAYNMPITLQLNGTLEVNALCAAVQHIVDRHEALRTRFERDSQVQVVTDPWTVSPTLVDLSELTDERRQRELDRVKREVARRPFDLWSAPPLRLVVVRVGTGQHVLLVVVHHIACDGWSLGVLARELSVAYLALCAGRAPELPELPVQYGDFSLWQRDRLSGRGLWDELAHWSGVLVDAPAALDLPTDRPRPPDPTYDGGRTKLGLAEPLAVKLDKLAQNHGASLFMVVLAAYATVLSRLSGQDEVVIGTATAGRSRPEIDNLVGCFIDVVPLRVDVSGDPSVADLLARARAVCLDAYAHQELPFERLVEHLKPERDLSRTPIFQVMLNGQDTPKHSLRWPGVEVIGEDPEPGVSKYDLTLDLHRVSTGIVLDLEFNRDVFETRTAERLVQRVGAVLEWLAGVDSGASVSGVEVPSPFDSGKRMYRTGEGRSDQPAPTVQSGPTDPVAHLDAVESIILDCIHRVLDKPLLGIFDDFFDHGGSSMSAMALVLEIEQATGHRLALRDLLRETTAASLAARVRATRPEQLPTDHTDSHAMKGVS